MKKMYLNQGLGKLTKNKIIKKLDKTKRKRNLGNKWLREADGSRWKVERVLRLDIGEEFQFFLHILPKKYISFSWEH